MTIKWSHGTICTSASERRKFCARHYDDRFRRETGSQHSDQIGQSETRNLGKGANSNLVSAKGFLDGVADKIMKILPIIPASDGL
jgi:hypothetical protein